MNDVCETWLSYNFRPELRYSQTEDDSRKEPYWVARPDSGGNIMIGYLFSYYYDLGSVQYGCSPPEFWPVAQRQKLGCHNGDSENIWLLLAYDSTTSHWVLAQASYSEHENWATRSPDANTGYAYADLEYPDHPGSYPRVWVSEQKHANYFAYGDCQGAGGFLGAGTEQCDADNVTARLDWSNLWNVGSQAHPFMTSVIGRDSIITSRNPSYEYYGAGGQECYWTERDFRGWVPNNLGGAQAASYLSKLAHFGFSTASGASSPCGSPPPGGGGGGNYGFTVSISGPSPIQPYASCQYSAQTVSGTPPFSYAWTQDGSPVGDGTMYYHNGGSASDFQLGVTVTDANGNTASNSVTVSLNDGAPSCNDQ